tara:strand:- start:1544 stop:1738 length:195 start_codon:yes stop_codon:yes gene_type:complete
MSLYKISKSSDSAFPYNIWSEDRNSFIAKVYTKEMAEALLSLIKDNESYLLLKKEKALNAKENR